MSGNCRDAIHRVRLLTSIPGQVDAIHRVRLLTSIPGQVDAMNRVPTENNNPGKERTHEMDSFSSRCWL